MNDWLARRVVGFAHQGGAGEGTPGTVATMRRALDNGAAALEFDLHLTGDGELVVNHDPVLEFEGRTAEIATTDLAGLRAVKPELATLEEILVAFPGVPLTVEAKARRAAEPAARRLALEVPGRPVIMTAFAPGTVAAIRRAAPGLDTAPGWTTNLGFWLLSRVWSSPRLASGHEALQVARRLDQVAIVKRIPVLRRLRVTDRRLVRAAHRRGLAVHVWTLNEDDEMRDALDLDVDGIFTDRPSVLTSTLRATGHYWPPAAEG